jgi:Predicted membrane protein
MFPIYGMASLLKPVCTLLKKQSLWLRGCVYTLCIFTGEYLTGSFLRRFEACPWDYSKSPLNVKGLIRLDYAPLWFGAGLLFEKILCRH